MYQVIIVIHVLLGLGVIGLVLMQQGKGADAGAAFGTGSAGSVFGAQGAASFLSRATAILATLFFSTSLGLAVINGHKGTETDLMATPVTEQKDTGLPSVQGTKNDTPPPVDVPSIPVTPPTVPTAQVKPTVSEPAATTPSTAANGKKAETPKTEEDNKPAKESKPTEQVKPVEEAKPVVEKKAKVEKKAVEPKPTVKNKKAETAHKSKETKKDR